MTIIVNLSTIHNYSINDTVAAFVQICNQFLANRPGFFQKSNLEWVMEQFQDKYADVIDAYKLGKMSTQEFLEKLSEIFHFMNDTDQETRYVHLANAWNAGIKVGEETQSRFSLLVEQAQNQPVYLISNTNELNINAILALLKKSNPDLEFKDVIDTSITDSKDPVEILPGIYFCLSYRFGAFKTASLLEDLSKEIAEPIILVSQYPEDLEKGEQLGFDVVLNADDFYSPVVDEFLQKK